ncbi:putative triacylglycerol lipase [Erysiphe necator]|uniref:Putative triacylglycerol lipase n=1 Tax=Uncinula necator TaxID=52586 RepID=A0A0B1P4U6_UNCNE|nr:putative triacylglycerol lipase [Erysiphe necator]
MVHVPVFARLNLAEYFALVSSFILMGLEALIRISTLALPSSIISLFYGASRRLFNCFSSSTSHRPNIRNSNISASIRKAADFVDLCALFGYYVEEHLVQTEDGYMLGIHRLAWKKGEKEHPVNHGMKGTRKNVVYLHHGLLMCSEVWVCLTDEQRCLPFRLVEQGYDVWLGNNRGNKYSKKNLNLSPNKIPFWEFCMDQFAFHDIPDTIQYILETTSVKSLSYIGFSQGTAQAFASLAVNPKLNQQVNVFIGLAPAMSPAGLSNRIVDALIKASPQVLFLLFGRRSILSSTTTWQSILYPPIFCRAIDLAIKFLFGWKTLNISSSQKLAAYHHLYSFTSTKSVVHWFQVIRTKSFQMYDDDQSKILSLRTSDRFSKVAKFPTRNIKSPIYLLYGGCDSLVDINDMLRELPSHTVAIQIPHYEHLDFLWAREVDTLVFPHVFDALNNFCDTENSTDFRGSEYMSQTLENQCRRPTMLDVTSDSESRRPDSSDTYSSLFELRRKSSSDRTFETPGNKNFRASNRPESEGQASFIDITRTPNSATFQSNLPRPSSNVRRRTRVQKNCNDVSEESSRHLSPSHLLGNCQERKQSSYLALDGPNNNSYTSIESNNVFGSKLFAGKASSTNGYLNDIDTKSYISKNCSTDSGKTSEKKKNIKVKKPNYFNLK